MTSTQRRVWGLRLAGVGLVLAVAAVIGLSFAQFDGAFTHVAIVTVSAPRAGLVLDPQAKVKLRGVEIGRVTHIRTDNDRATLTLALQPDAMALIPANVTVDIASTTVFGAKYVNFEIPPARSSEHLVAGAHLTAGAVTVEFDTLFQQLVAVLTKVRPDRINATLDALAIALRGRGADLGQLLADADAYLAQMNPTLPAVHADVDKTAAVTQVYADTAPDLLRAAGNVTVTSNSIVAEQDQLDQALLSVIGLNDPGNPGAVLRDNLGDLGSVTAEFVPSTGLLDRFSPVINCLIIGLDRLQPLDNREFGGGQEGLALNAGFMYGGTPYTAPLDLPKVHATGAPNCWGLPVPMIGPQYPHAPYLVDDTATVPYAPSTVLDPNAPSIFQLLYGNTYHGKPIDSPVPANGPTPPDPAHTGSDRTIPR